MFAALIALLVLAGAAGQLDAATQRRVSPFWTSIEDCLTTVHLRNNLISEELVVQPIFHLEDGTAVPVDAVTLTPRGNASIQVNELMNALGYGGGRFGGAEFLYEREHGGALNVETEVVMPANNLAYSVESFSASPRATNEKHGVFWLPMRSAELFFAVYNSSDQTVTVQPELTYDGATSDLDPIVLPPNGFGKLRMEGPRPRGPKDQRVGSIALRHDGPSGAVQATGWIDCDETGYSSMMAFTDPGLHRGNELYGAQIFIGKHASLASLGRGADVESHLVLKNMSPVTAAVDAEVYYDDAGAVGVAPVAIGEIGAGEVLSVSFDELQRRSLIPRSVSEASVVVRHRGDEGALMGRVFGISANRTFGFYSKLESYAGGGYDAVHWTTAGDRESVITVTNFGYEADDVTVTLAYNGGSFDLPTFPLEPHASATVNVRDYLSSLPNGVIEGGYAVHGKDRRTSKLLTKQHVISADEDVALPFYGTYVYAVALDMANTNAVTLAVGETTTVTLWMQYSDYTQKLCWWCSNITSNSSIVTMSGSSATRTIAGQQAGNATVQSSSWEVIDEFGQTDYIYSAPAKPVQAKWTGALTVTAGSPFTIEQKDDSITFTATASTATGDFTGNKHLKIAITAPQNPSGIALAQGASGKTCESASVSAGGQVTCALTVQTSASNPNHGQLVYTITLVSNSSDAVIAGSPKTVTVNVQQE